MQGLGSALDGKNAEAKEVAYKALKHSSAGVRRVNAVQVLPRSAETVTALLAAGLLKDSRSPSAAPELCWPWQISLPLHRLEKQCWQPLSNPLDSAEIGGSATPPSLRGR